MELFGGKKTPKNILHKINRTGSNILGQFWERHCIILGSKVPELKSRFSVFKPVALRTVKTPGVLAVLSAVGLK